MKNDMSFVVWLIILHYVLNRRKVRCGHEETDIFPFSTKVGLAGTCGVSQAKNGPVVFLLPSHECGSGLRHGWA